MKATTSELNMLQAQVSEQKAEIERLTHELGDYKRRFYEQKRREQLVRETQRSAQEGDMDPLKKQQEQFHLTQPRFVGGGFSLHS